MSEKLYSLYYVWYVTDDMKYESINAFWRGMIILFCIILKSNQKIMKYYSRMVAVYLSAVHGMAYRRNIIAAYYYQCIV